MKNEKVFLQGLNFRTPDSEAAPGTCRILSNLYPSGDVQSPMWKPAAEPESYYVHNVGSRSMILSAYAWHRTNAASVLIYLAYSTVTAKGSLCTIPLNDDGSIETQHLNDAGEMVATTFTEIYSLNHVTTTTEASFAQMGDTLVVCVTESGEPAGLIVVTTDNNSTTVARPFNVDLPEAAVVVEYGTAGKSSASGWCCMRAFYKLIDGTLVPASSIRVIFAPKGNTLLFSLRKIIVSSDPFNFKDIVSGVEVYVSIPQTDKALAIQNALFHTAGTITNVFSDSPSPVEADPLSDDFQTSALLDADILSANGVLCSNVASYNKLLLMAGAQYDFARPSRIYGNKPGESIDSSLPTVEYITDGNPTTTGFPVTPSLKWKSVIDSSEYAIEVRYDRTFTAYFDSIGGTPVYSSRDCSMQNGSSGQTNAEWISFGPGDDGRDNGDGTRTRDTVVLDGAYLSVVNPVIQYNVVQETGWYQFRIKSIVNGVSSDWTDGIKEFYPNAEGSH